MATTVNAAFSEFLSGRVNLDQGEAEGARRSRDWLMSQVDEIPTRRSEFPQLYPDVHIHYGSFARRTKIRELDDLDMIIGISALGTTYLDTGSRVTLTVPDGIALRSYCHDGGNLLNSRKIINLFVDYFGEIPQYANSEVKRDGSAAVLNLTSYTWSFDIVPAFFTMLESDGRTYYIIPDGSGHWMKTDPRIDQARVSTVNQAHDGNVLNAIRIMKYWNRRRTMVTMAPYVWECIILDYYEQALGKASAFVDLELPGLFTYVSSAVLGAVYDPKRIQGDINPLSWDDRVSISARAGQDAQRAAQARRLEDGGNHREAIGVWRQVFGEDFPTFG
jgi:hypothetical protein